MAAVEDGGGQRLAATGRPGVEAGQAGRTQLARRHVDDAPQRRRIIQVGRQPQVRHNVFDLWGFECGIYIVLSRSTWSLASPPYHLNSRQPQIRHRVLYLCFQGSSESAKDKRLRPSPVWVRGQSHA